MNVREHVERGQKARFEFYHMGVLYYRTDKGLLFEVPVEDTGSGVLNAEDKAILFMRWIRKQLQRNEEGRAECGVVADANANADG